MYNVIKTRTLYLQRKTEEKTPTTLAYSWRVKKGSSPRVLF